VAVKVRHPGVELQIKLDFIIMKADELSQGQPFNHIDDLISQDELRAISDHYKTVAGFALKA
jgi:predicted unusual protein kinase regulating ubiquinone biosynthesis (AarF/ABC1/UbiB family)